MNPDDYKNLNFILSQSPSQLYDWWEALDEDEQKYALSLIREYQRELLLDTKKALEKVIDIVYDEEVEDLSLATDYLKQFQLNK